MSLRAWWGKGPWLRNRQAAEGSRGEEGAAPLVGFRNMVMSDPSGK